MNKPIRIKGWIDNAYKEGDKYVLKLHPEYSQIFDEIEDLVSLKKFEFEQLKSLEGDPLLQETKDFVYLDRIFDDSKIIFETIRQPKLTGELSRVQRDEELIGKFVEVIGHIQILKGGNAFISFHIVDPAIRSIDLDPYP